jgi:Tfp pilus assembly protein PilO
MVRLTREQIKIIYISLIVLVFFILFWLFVYGPQSRRLALIKKELMRAEAQITEIKNLVGKEELAAAVTQLRIKLNTVTSQLPQGEEVVISNLSQDARNLNIEVKNIIPSDTRLLSNRIAGYKIEELPISMKLVCEYNILGRYLEKLRNNFPVLVRIRKIDIVGKGEGKPKLDITLEISAYLATKS